ncbi:hypothetical protein KP509_04G019700 [Ceratopteris richardii]|uniref:Phosphatidylinositol-specific phospholipase C X domain-containing protein n=1 Tax=Ceratopteris richardii TaxID=49495 RepID=A0A8T2UXC1_CERRI|nr:hypothetical protein KP509_04G019700 [Ceratopteris richardii]
MTLLRWADEGVDFPGSNYHFSDRSQWMAQHLDLEKTRVKDIIWPGTHDSATDKIGLPYTTRPFAQCQTQSIYRQLLQGVRVLDIRVDKDGFVCHGILTSYKVDVVINAVKQFLNETTSEFIILEIRTEYGHDDPPGFDIWLIEELKDFLIKQDESVFECTLSELLPKRLICVWKPQTSPPPYPCSPLWSAEYLRDDWIDTDLPYTKFMSNLYFLAEQPPADERCYFYRVENTCTPQASSAIACVKPVTSRIRPYARLFISQAYKRGLGDYLQILSSDFVEDDFIDACIGATLGRLED